MAKVLVVGGAGYVGSATCAWLKDSGHEVWVLDNLTTGHHELLLGNGFIFGSAGDQARVIEILKEKKIEGVFHFAARSLVGESVLYPEEYYENNVLQTQHLLEAMLFVGVRKFVFSSTCAIFGDPDGRPISETLSKKPISPYGQTKLQVEELLEKYAATDGLESVSLRYFNAAGAEPQNRVGEWHENETHLIPNILKAATHDQPIRIFGTDYPTDDGTCVRDYVHVTDLAQAHEAAMLRLLNQARYPTQNKTKTQGSFEAFNLGSETGYSVRQIISACEKVLGKKLKSVEEGRRPGDPPKLVADSSLAKKELGFVPGKRGIDEIISSAWEWEKKRNLYRRPAIFLDRDGTLNVDPGYLNDPDQLNLLPKVGEGLAALKAAGYLLIVVSNQSGVNRGLVQRENLPVIHKRLQDLLKPWSVQLDDFFFCIHLPEQECECRKPKPKLLLDAVQKHKIDLKRSFMMGDKASDLGAGNQAQCRGSLLVRTGEGEKTAQTLDANQAAFIGDSLLDLAHWILNQETANS